MAANLTPQFLKAQEQYRRATTTEDEIHWLEVMLKEIPKHKSSEKLQAEIKQKLSAARKELEHERRTGGRKGHGVRIPRQGAGTAVLLGAPNVGKSQLLRSLTRATPEVADFPFTTRQPQPGMMPWEDVMVQLIDTPPITRDYCEPYMQGLIRAADVALLLLDLATDDGLDQCLEVIQRLEHTKTRLAATSYLDEDDIGLSFTQTLLVANKIDVPDAQERWALFQELGVPPFRPYVISARHGQGLEALRRAIYEALDVVRVYSKLPAAKAPDMDRPFTLRRGQTVLDLAEQIHKDFVDNLKFARVWGKNVHDGTVVKGDYVPEDRDIVELHV